MPKGDYAFFDAGRDYPAEARALGIEGAIRVRLVVDDHGKVTSRVLLNKLGHGLDELALRRAAEIEFEPAIDTDDHPVTSAVVWTFKMTLPKNAQPLSAPSAPSVSNQPASPGGMQNKPLAEPVEVRKMPLPGHCAGKYTDEARAAATARQQERSSTGVRTTYYTAIPIPYCIDTIKSSRTPSTAAS